MTAILYCQMQTIVRTLLALIRHTISQSHPLYCDPILSFTQICDEVWSNASYPESKHRTGSDDLYNKDCYRTHWTFINSIYKIKTLVSLGILLFIPSNISLGPIEAQKWGFFLIWAHFDRFFIHVTKFRKAMQFVYLLHYTL